MKLNNRINKTTFIVFSLIIIFNSICSAQIQNLSDHIGDTLAVLGKTELYHLDRLELKSKLFLKEGDFIQLIKVDGGWVNIKLIRSGLSKWIYLSADNSENIKFETPEKFISRSVIGKAKIVYEVDLHPEISAPPGFVPKGEIITQLKKDDIVEVIEIFDSDLEFRYSVKIRTATGKIGYIRSYLQIIESYNDKGAILKIHLSRPYEYEGDVEAVDNDINKYQEFIENHPNSAYVGEALLTILSLHFYNSQFKSSDKDKSFRRNQIINTYIMLIEQLDVDSVNFYSLESIKECLIKFFPSSLN